MIGRVVAVHPETDQIDVALLGGGRINNIPILAPLAGRNVGEAGLPAVSAGLDNATATGDDDTYAVIGYLKGQAELPVAIGFLGPKDSNLLKRPDGTSLRRDVGGQVHVDYASGVETHYYAGGGYIAIGTDEEIELDPSLMPPAGTPPIFLLSNGMGGVLLDQTGLVNITAPAGFLVNNLPVGAYTLPIASASVLGGIKVGANLSIDGSGVLSAAAAPYTLPIASTSVLGGIKVGTNLSINGSGVLSAAGSVSSVALTVPGVLFSVSGSPITGAGTLALTLLTQTANTVLAGPTSGGAATPTMRALVEADIPTIAYTKLSYSGLTTGQVLRAISATAAAFGALDLANASAVSGILPSANGGSGINNGSFTLTFPATGTAALRASAATAGRVGFWSDAASLSHSADLFWDNANSRLGIGTASPTKKLHLSSASLGDGVYFGAAGPALELGDNAVFASATMHGLFALATAAGHYGLVAGDVLFAAYGASRGNISINSNYSGAGTTDVSIQPGTGNVGIGNAAPRKKVDVTGPILATDYIRSEGYGTPPTGEGVELGYINGAGYVTAYSRTASAWKPINIRGSTVTFQSNGNTFMLGSDTSGTAFYLTDAGTNGSSTALVLYHRTSQTPVTGFGADIAINLDSSASSDRAALLIRTIWATATDASRKARSTFHVYDTTNRVAIILEASGTAAMIGFLGASAVVRQSLSAAAPAGGTGAAAGGWDTAAHRDAAITLMNDLRTALINLGLAA